MPSDAEADVGALREQLRGALAEIERLIVAVTARDALVLEQADVIEKKDADAGALRDRLVVMTDYVESATAIIADLDGDEEDERDAREQIAESRQALETTDAGRGLVAERDGLRDKLRACAIEKTEAEVIVVALAAADPLYDEIIPQPPGGLADGRPLKNPVCALCKGEIPGGHGARCPWWLAEQWRIAKAKKRADDVVKTAPAPGDES